MGVGERDPTAVLVLAGGEGRRLQGPKAWLPWDGRPLLVRVVERLTPLAPEAVWVAARPGQDLPAGAYRRVDDDVPDGGPLAGLAAGLAAIAAAAEPETRVAVAACDYPFADPALFRALAAAHPEADLVVPRGDGHLHPLLALWRARLAGTCRQLLDAGERRVRLAVDAADARIVEGEALRPGADPARALLNVNDPESLARALALREEET